MAVEMILEPVEEDAADAARDIAVGKPEIFLGPMRESRIEGRVVRGAGGAKAGVERLGVLGAWNRRVVVRKRVLKWTAGTCGLAMWATRLIPVAKKRGSSSAPGIEAANSGEKLPPTVETLTPTFSNTLPVICPRTPPPPGEPSGSVRSHGIISKLDLLPASRSIASNAAQIRVRNASNQSRAACC